MKNKLILYFLLFISGCRSLESIKLKEMDYSLKEIRKGIYDISGEARTTSENQREISTQYFGRSAPLDQNPMKNKERFYAKFFILGTQPPYDVVVEVRREKRQGGHFVDSGVDADLSSTIASELKARLNQSRDTRNLIDDFRPF